MAVTDATMACVRHWNPVMEAMYKENGYLLYPLGLYQPRTRQWQAVVVITLERLVEGGNPTLQHTRALPNPEGLFSSELEAKECALGYGRTLIATRHPDLPK